MAVRHQQKGPPQIIFLGGKGRKGMPAGVSKGWVSCWTGGEGGLVTDGAERMTPWSSWRCGGIDGAGRGIRREGARRRRLLCVD